MAGMFLYWGCLDAPHLFAPCTFIHPHMFICPPGVQTPPYIPHTLCNCMFSGASTCCGGCRGPLTCWTLLLHAGHLPLHGSASPYVLHLHLLVGFPVHLCFGDICMCYGEYSPYVGGLGVPPYVGVWAASAALGAHMLYLAPSCSSLCLMFLP